MNNEITKSINKEEYMETLSKNLKSLPKQDREDAIAFYDEYLSDLAENNPEMMKSLDDPSQVAAQIKADAAMKKTLVTDVKHKKGISAAWAVLLGVLALPIGLPVAIAIAAIAISLIVVALSLVISLFAIALSVIVSAFASLVSGVTLIFTSPATGVFYLGFGLLGLGLGYLMAIGFYDLSKRLFVLIARFINRIRLKIQTKQASKKEVA